MALALENELSGSASGDEDEGEAQISMQLTHPLTEPLSAVTEEGVNRPEPAETTKKNLASDQPFKYLRVHFRI